MYLGFLMCVCVCVKSGCLFQDLEVSLCEFSSLFRCYAFVLFDVSVKYYLKLK